MKVEHFILQLHHFVLFPLNIYWTSVSRFYFIGSYITFHLQTTSHTHSIPGICVLAPILKDFCTSGECLPGYSRSQKNNFKCVNFPVYSSLSGQILRTNICYVSFKTIQHRRRPNEYETNPFKLSRPLTKHRDRIEALN